MERRNFVYTFVLGSGALLTHGINLKAGPVKPGDIHIKVIYNNTGKAEGLKTAWGLSMWIEQENNITLFDTGGDAKILLSNLEQLGLNVSKINRIVISHNHWDHTGGLKDILEKIPQKTKVYVVDEEKAGFIKKYSAADIVGISSSKKIAENTWLTGSINASLKGNGLHEMAIILENDDSIFMFTGCSHPGIVKMSKTAKTIYPEKDLKLVAGGFHLLRESEEGVKEISDQLKELNIDTIAPSHCTGEKAIEIFRDEWGDKFVEMHIGDGYTIS